jgi:hypothetical protein
MFLLECAPEEGEKFDRIADDFRDLILPGMPEHVYVAAQSNEQYQKVSPTGNIHHSLLISQLHVLQRAFLAIYTQAVSPTPDSIGPAVLHAQSLKQLSWIGPLNCLASAMFSSTRLE